MLRNINKKNLVSLIKYLGITFDEVVVEIVIDEVIFDSIEWRRKGNQVILHKFIEDLNYEFNYDELPNKLKKEIYLFLLREFLN
jgi:hypothetical protein